MELVIYCILVAIILGYFIYEYIYYNSEKFNVIKESIKKYTDNCNLLNIHIEELKRTYLGEDKLDYGSANYTDNSIYNFKRTNWRKMRNFNNVYRCSATICRNAQQQPFKYLCKYFNIKLDENSLEKFENVLNNFSAVEQGKMLLKKERDEVLLTVSDKIPFLIKSVRKKNLIRKLGFFDIDLSQLYFPEFYFEYISAGGNSHMSTDILLDIDNLNKFVRYLSEVVKFKKSIKGQRTLMTSSLREKIKSRDNYTCKKCGASIEKEPNLLLEIDHIIPLSKEGLTTEENLQTLCWKCNRSKGNKLENV